MERLKLTSYFGERHRTGRDFTGNALLDLHARNEIAASILLRGTQGFGLGRHLRTDRSLTLSEDLPLLTIAVDARPRIEAVLEQTLSMTTPGLVTLEHACLLDGDGSLARGAPGSQEEEAKLTVYLGRHEQAYQIPANEAICDLLYRRCVAGATALLGVDGTARGHRQRAGFLSRRDEVPMMVIAVGSWDQIMGVLPDVSGLLRHPLLTVEPDHRAGSAVRGVHGRPHHRDRPAVRAGGHGPVLGQPDHPARPRARGGRAFHGDPVRDRPDPGRDTHRHQRVRDDRGSPAVRARPATVGRDGTGHARGGRTLAGRRGLGAGYALALGSVAVIMTATDAFTALFAWETLTVAFYLLAGFERDRGGRPQGAFIALVFGRISGAALLLGLMLLAARSHSLSLASFTHVSGGTARDAAEALLFAGFTIKVGLVPFQVWIRAGTRPRPGRPARSWPGWPSTSASTAYGGASNCSAGRLPG